MSTQHIILKKSDQLSGSVTVNGAKNAVLVIMASLILTDGISTLDNVPDSSDVRQMIDLLQDLGAHVQFDATKKQLVVNTSTINRFEVKPEIMNKMRASILVMGPLLARFGKAKVAFPGGCVLGARPVNYHLHGFRSMGVVIDEKASLINASLAPVGKRPDNARIVFEYPSVGATENILMFASLTPGYTRIVNAALEPEVFDLIDILRSMGAKIDVGPGAIVTVKGVDRLAPVHHAIVPDRLEAGALLLAAAITGGSIHIANARADHMELFLEKLREMGHEVTYGQSLDSQPVSGITCKATANPRAVNIKTGPYPGFPTDLQAPTMAALCLANGTSMVEETVFENRMMHVKELQKMGAQISLQGSTALIRGVDELYGCEVIATDIRASCALVLAGLVAQGETKMTGVHHWFRGYDRLEDKIIAMGAQIQIIGARD